ncbi:MAG: hypothetical protein B7733_18380 [Myxococcales bacterium FL481]|nr:MAG: hypothetical protein B7733_18380 [Myxococcales bacterium FL481]
MFSSESRWVHEHTRTLALALDLPDTRVAHEELARGRQAACDALAAAFVHGEVELGDDGLDHIHRWLHGHCGPATPEDRMHAVLHQPETAWRGLALAEILVEPQRMRALDEWPWLPVGSINVIASFGDEPPTHRGDRANPRTPPRPAQLPLKVTWETF